MRGNKSVKSCELRVYGIWKFIDYLNYSKVEREVMVKVCEIVVLV